MEKRLIPVNTIDIIGKQWRDKVNGNTYQSARIVINLDATGSGRTFYVMFSYQNYFDASRKILISENYIPENFCFSTWCIENNIILRYGVTDALKRDVIEWGKP